MLNFATNRGMFDMDQRGFRFWKEKGMAKKVTVTLVDDVDGEAPADETVEFGVDGVTYEIDLSSKNAEKLRNQLSTWVEHARRVSGRRRGRGVRARVVAVPASIASRVRRSASGHVRTGTMCPRVAAFPPKLSTRSTRPTSTFPGQFRLGRSRVNIGNVFTASGVVRLPNKHRRVR